LQQPEVVRRAEAAALFGLPDFFDVPYTCRPYIDAAVWLQGLGETVAAEQLTRFASERWREIQTAILCRVLYVRRPGGEFRRPMLGAWGFLGGTTYEDWPLEPIELVDGIPFLITDGYVLMGKAEHGTSYLRYCREHCDWRSDRFRQVDQCEAVGALDQLLSSKRWKKPLSEREAQLLEAQLG
jgi:hypothetical protein